MPFGFIKTEVNLPQEYFTSLDRGYPVDAFWFLLKLRSICLMNMLQQQIQAILLMPFGFIKTEINLPQEYVTAVDIGYPVDGFWLY